MKFLLIDNFYFVDKICPYCDGIGYKDDGVSYNAAPPAPVKVCYHCNGSGYLKEVKEFENTLRKLPTPIVKKINNG
mgnify:CR=1 FL=1